VRSEEALAALHPLERDEYERLLLKGFLHMEDQARAAVLGEAAEAEYQRVRALAASTKRRLLQEAEPAHALSHPPTDSLGQPWLLDIQATRAHPDGCCAGITDMTLGR
jgi:hypothetical protein